MKVRADWTSILREQELVKKKARRPYLWSAAWRSRENSWHSLPFPKLSIIPQVSQKMISRRPAMRLCLQKKIGFRTYINVFKGNWPYCFSIVRSIRRVQLDSLICMISSGGNKRLLEKTTKSNDWPFLIQFRLQYNLKEWDRMLLLEL